MSAAIACGLAACSAERGPLSYDQFKALASHEPGSESYFIDGDEQVVGEVGMVRAYNAYVDSFTATTSTRYGVTSQGLTVDAVGGQPDVWPHDTALHLTYCVSQASFGSDYNAVVAAIESAAIDWENVAYVNFQHVVARDVDCTKNTADVTFDVRIGDFSSGGGGSGDQPKSTILAGSFYPNAARSTRELLISQQGLGNISPLTVTGLMRHELGHVIGFRHEHIRPEAHASDLQCQDTPARDWLALTQYDSASVMHYSFCNGTRHGDYALTALDVTGAYQVYPFPLSVFDAWANNPHARAVAGDFNGDGRADIALVGGDGWTTIPMAFSNGDGSFTVTNAVISQFAGWANAPGAQVVAGDVNGDGRTDLILTGAAGWTTIPVAMSNGDGSFTVYNQSNASIPGWAQAPGAKALAGDVNGDGRADLILTGGADWTTIPLGFSNGDGTFQISNASMYAFPGWAQNATAKAAAADVNGDGRADIVLTGGAGWYTVPMAISQGNGSFALYNQPNDSISGWSQGPGAKFLMGDVNGDHRADVILTGAEQWVTIPLGLSNGDGTLAVSNALVSQFPTWAQDSHAQAVSGDFNGDGRADVALVGGSISGRYAWWTLPVAFSNGDGTFRVTNTQVP